MKMLNKYILFFLLAMLAMPMAKAQEYSININPKAEKALTPLPFEGKSPDGETLAVNNQYFVKNGKPWFPIMGEIHYNRVRPEKWEAEILKMKSGGLSIVATYVFWNEHETAKGVWDWKGNRDLNQFIRLCQKHNMDVWLRIGPWCHGEQLHGGFPEWIQKLKGHRSDDPEYLKEATKLYNQIGQQTKGLYFAQGGPIIGVQLENEYDFNRPTHIGTLKKMALANNITPVYFSVTGNTTFNDKIAEVIPLQGAYAYRGWERAGGVATKDFLYGNDQWILTDAVGKVFYDLAKYPRGLCEQGAGSQMTYQNRFVVEPEVVEAHLQNQIGRGMNLVGYYMFHGGTQTPGLKEPGYPESYDFQSPISEFNLIRPSYKYLKVLHTFVKDFGSDLAQMPVFEPENPIRDEKNTQDLRYVARANGNSGFLFLGNTQVRIKMPDKTVTMQVNLPNETIKFPSILFKGETMAILPFNLKAGSALIKYATAQPFAKLINGKNITLFFQQLPGVNTQLAIDANTIKTKTFAGWQSKMEDNQVVLKASQKMDVSFLDTEGNTINLVFLTRKQTENAWRIQLKNQDAVLITDADVLASDNKITLQQINQPNFNVQVYPKKLNAFANQTLNSTLSLFDSYLIKTPVYSPKTQIAYPQKQTAVINLPSALPKNVSDIILNVDYLGNAVKLTQNEKYMTDNLFNGTTWELGGQRFLNKGDIKLDIQDWNPKTTGVTADLVQEITSKGSMFKSIKVWPQYQTTINLK